MNHFERDENRHAVHQFSDPCRSQLNLILIYFFSLILLPIYISFYSRLPCWPVLADKRQGGFRDGREWPDPCHHYTSVSVAVIPKSPNAISM